MSVSIFINIFIHNCFVKQLFLLKSFSVILKFLNELNKENNMIDEILHIRRITKME